MNDFINPDPYVNKVEDVVCRDCNKTFQINAQYDKNGFPVSFIPKYCPECNMKPKITGNNGSWGAVNIESAKVPQRNVEGLEEAIQTLAENGLKTMDKINDTKLILDLFTASQSEINIKQSDFNISVLQLVREIHKSLIIGFSVFVFLMLVTWSYLTYTFLKH